MPRILTIEDDAVTAKEIVAELSSHGLEVDWVANGREGLVRAVTPGTYRVPPPQVESMYRPNWQAVGETPGEMVIKGR